MDLEKLATFLSSQGFVVSLDIKEWDGCIPPKKEWGTSVKIRLLPEGVITSLDEVKSNLHGSLAEYSILCSDGFFIPSSVLPEWDKKYRNGVDKFTLVKTTIAQSVELMKSAAKSTASSRATDLWIKTHSGEKPPLSAVNYASNLAASLVPSSAEILDMFSVARRINTHSYLCSHKILDCDEKYVQAWVVINELGVGNIKRLLDCVSKLKNDTYHRLMKVDKVVKATKLFLTTSLLRQSGLSESVQKLFDMVNNVALVDIDFRMLDLQLSDVISKATPLTTVSGFLKEA